MLVPARFHTSRKWLLGLLLSTAGALSVEAANGNGSNLTPEQKAGHHLRRLQYGHYPFEFETIVDPAALNLWLTVQRNPDRGILVAQGYPMGDYPQMPLIEADYGMPSVGASFSTNPPSQTSWNISIDEIAEVDIARASFSAWQLQEKLAHFWRNHFNTSYNTLTAYFVREHGLSAASAANYAAYFEWLQMDRFRFHAFGSFEQLLRDSIQGEAMLIYLDNVSNDGTTTPNENLARELLELHTFGATNPIASMPEQHYTQADIVNVARILSGHGLSFSGGAFTPAFDSTKHYIVPSPGYTLFNGLKPGAQVIPGPNGALELDTLLSRLAGSPVTAENVCRKLIEYFVGYDPGPCGATCDPLLSNCITAWGSSFMPITGNPSYEVAAGNGNIQAVLSVILSSSEFNEDCYLFGMAKSPLEFVGSVGHAFGAAVSDGNSPALTKSRLAGVRTFMRDRLGRNLYRFPSPDGFHAAGDGQLSTSRYVSRAQFCQEIYSQFPTYWSPLGFGTNNGSTTLYRNDGFCFFWLENLVFSGVNLASQESVVAHFFRTYFQEAPSPFGNPGQSAVPIVRTAENFLAFDSDNIPVGTLGLLKNLPTYLALLIATPAQHQEYLDRITQQLAFIGSSSAFLRK